MVAFDLDLHLVLVTTPVLKIFLQSFPVAADAVHSWFGLVRWGGVRLYSVIATFWPCFGIAHSSIRLCKRSNGIEGGIGVFSWNEHSSLVWQVDEGYIFAFTSFQITSQPDDCHKFLKQPHSYTYWREKTVLFVTDCFNWSINFSVFNSIGLHHLNSRMRQYHPPLNRTI